MGRVLARGVRDASKKAPSPWDTFSLSVCSKWVDWGGMHFAGGWGRRGGDWGGLVREKEEKKEKNLSFENAHWAPVRHCWALHRNHPSPFFISEVQRTQGGGLCLHPVGRLELETLRQMSVLHSELVRDS